jgi:hypothetical protein
MATPFEELEYLADQLPEEGESIIVTRMYGELVCQQYVEETVLRRSSNHNQAGNFNQTNGNPAPANQNSGSTPNPQSGGTPGLSSHFPGAQTGGSIFRVDRAGSHQTSNTGPHVKPVKTDGVSDQQTYGQLLQIRERMDQIFWNNLWPWSIFIYWSCVLCNYTLDGTKNPWLIYSGVIIIGTALAMSWARYRLWKYFQHHAYPILREIVCSGPYDKFQLITAMKQHPELKSVVKALCQWTV